MDKAAKLSKRSVSTIIIYGMVGHIAWCIENAFLNLYVYRTITTNLSVVSAMVAASAVIATFATIVMGWVSDRVGKRKPFMTYGYMLWGVSVMLFAVFSIKNMQSAFGVDRDKAIILACVGMVFLDCLMSFIGSTANDAAFHAWVTDNTNKFNRGKTEALITVLAVLATVITTVPFEMTGVTTNKYFDAAGNAVKSAVEGGTTVMGNWTLFYCVLGGVTILAGIIGLFLIKDNPSLKPQKSMPFKELFYGFRPSVVKKNKYLYLVFATLAISYIANNCFSNYLLIYLQNTLKCDEYVTFLGLGYLLPYAIIYGSSAILGIIIGVVVDKKTKKATLIIPGAALSCVGAVLMYVFSPNFFEIGMTTLVLFCVGAFIQSMGATMVAVVCLTTIRNLTPPDKVGRFLGVKMVFAVMLPMCIGSVVSGIVSSSDKYISGFDEFGHAVYTCPPVIFLLTAGIVLFAILTAIPLVKAPNGALVTPAEGVPTAEVHQVEETAELKDA